jgi:hypothetical protein
MKILWEAGSVPSILFTSEHCRLASTIQDIGLKWEPQVGCFVWDRMKTITTPSPFGENIYYILDLKPFLRRFGSTDMMSKALVWLPDWGQALWICKRIGVDDDAITAVSQGVNPSDASALLLGLYKLILLSLERMGGVQIPPYGTAHTLPQNTCGPLDDFEACHQDWEADVKQRIQSLFSSRRLAVLATQHEGEPYASLVAFAATEDLKTIIFATTRSTRKYSYLSSSPSVALLIDDRTNEASDFRNAMAITATGHAEEIPVTDGNRFLQLYLAKHPYLSGFIASPTCALVKVEIDTYYTVRRFQQVFEYHIR